jgi:hypothetical protein
VNTHYKEVVVRPRRAVLVSVLALIALCATGTSAHASTVVTPARQAKLAVPPHLTRAQARHDLRAIKRHTRVSSPKQHKAKAHTSDLIVCDWCGPQPIPVTLCPGDWVRGECSANNGTTLIWLADPGATTGYVAGDSIGHWEYNNNVGLELFSQTIGVAFNGYQPRVLSRNGGLQRLAMAWGWESKYRQRSGWTRWYWGWSRASDGILVPFNVGGNTVYAQDSTNNQGVFQFNYPFASASHPVVPGAYGDAYRLKLAVAWYDGNSVARTQVYRMPIYTNVGAWWYWGVNNVVDGFHPN